MKKLNILILLFLLSSAAVFSSSVDVNRAMQVAQTFYKQSTGQIPVLSLAYQCTNTDPANGVGLGENLYYVFNVSGNGGFIMVSAEDAARPILGYNTTGQFAINNAPPVIADWFVKYSKEISYAKANTVIATKEVTDKWARYAQDPAHITKQLRASNAVGPLLNTTWDQPYPYNILCPQDASAPNENNGRVLTGCGATAMSQIMRYWSYPAHGTGQNSYQSNYGTLSANFGSTTYNWANMPNSVTANNVSNDVGTLMYDCGVAVDMIYGPNESSSYILPGNGVPASCMAAYTAYFGYDATTIQGYERGNYPTESTWLSFIDAEMAASRPIQYAGSGTSGGHTFVLDGADGNGNYHINWGWSGVDNGYYSVDALAPGPYANGDFSSNESMICGIQPPNTTVVSSGIELYEAITATPNPVPFLQTFTVTTNLYNNGSSSFSGAYCCALFDVKGNFIRLIGDILYTGSNPLPSGDYYNSGLTFTDTSTSVTVPGTYSLGIFYQPTGVSTWTLAGQSTYSNPISITVSAPIDNIAVASTIVPSPSTFVQGQAASVNVNIGNNGTSTYYGTYEAVLLDLQGNYVETIGTYTESTGLPAGYDYLSPYLTFSSSNIASPQGLYILAIAEEAQSTSQYYYCDGTTYINPILINVVNSTIGVLAVTDVNSDALKIYPNPATNVINIDAGDVRGSYTLTIFNTLGQQMNESAGVLNGQKLTADVSGFAEGLYTVQLKTASGSLNSRIVVK
jgi:hypothetical protein